VVTACTCVALGLNLLCGMAIAAAFGAGARFDVYLAATTLPAFIIGIVSNALSFVFIPVYAEYRNHSQEEAQVVVNSFMNLLLALSIAICGIGFVFANWIVRNLTPGLAEEQIARTALFLRWLLPTITLTVANELMASLSYSTGRFVVPSLCKIIQPLLTLVFILELADRMDTFSLVLATLTATLIQSAVLAAATSLSGAMRYSAAFVFRHEGVAKMLKLMTPLVLGMMFYRIVPVFDRWLASQLPEGSISVLGYATKLTSALPAIIGSGLSLAIFPVMAKHATVGEWSGVRDIISKAVRMLLFLSIPIAVSLAAFGRPVIQMIFEHGAFTEDVTRLTYYAFSIYLASVPAMIVGSVIAQGFYVLQDMTTPILVGIGETVFYIFICIVLIPLLGYLSMPVTYAIYFNLSVLVTGYLVGKKLRFSLFHEIIFTLLGQIVSTIGCCAVTYGLTVLLRPTPVLAIALIVVGWAVYFLIERSFFKSEESGAVLAFLIAQSPIRQRPGVRQS
jgi:putative peptidoglycan lipid II flippase